MESYFLSRVKRFFKGKPKSIYKNSSSNKTIRRNCFSQKLGAKFDILISTPLRGPRMRSKIFTYIILNSRKRLARLLLQNLQCRLAVQQISQRFWIRIEVSIRWLATFVIYFLITDNYINGKFFGWSLEGEV